MRRIKNLFSPIITLIVVQVVWIGLVVLWVLWFMGRHNELRKLAEQYRPELVPPHIDWPVLISGIVMLALVLAGLYVIFIYWRRQSRLYAEQKTFISQITHELKSPLASIQLHLETIRLRRPSPDKMERFLDTMLADTERLNNLISNFLMAAKLEQRTSDNRFSRVDLSSFVQGCVDDFHKNLQDDSSLSAEIEPGIKADIDAEGVQMVIRNLLENAFLYSAAAPEVRLTLKSSGKHCLLAVSDNGRGIEPKEMKNIFRMFYRVRESGETIKGTGLGLYIVRSVVRLHKGKVTVASNGPGKGSTFTVSLPVAGNQ
ncbi:MAG TPA: HAMP domain-containing sensor histidine kinase [Geobacteraceae bacterium]|nr:HAMP domain-containing sensor histidine kinase [Geobacteraceae bacterium]